MTVNLTETGLNKIVNNFDLFYIDIWGVLHNGIKLNDDAVNSNIDLRVTKLGHLQRGGNPSAADRMLAIRLAVQSVKALCAGETAIMVGILNNKVSNTPMQDVVKQHVISDELQGLLSVFCR